MIDYGLGEKEAEYFDRYGGYCLGLYLIELYGADYDLRIPKYTVISIDESLDHNELERIVEEYPSGFGIKTSGHKESFSDHAVRGLNSSRGYFWDGTDPETAISIIENASKQAQINGVAFVIQEYLKGENVSGVITAHAFDNLAACETTQETGSLYMEQSRGRVSYLEVFPINGSKDTDILTESAENLILVAERIEQFKKRFLFDLDTELFLVDGNLFVTQLRPVPSSGCIDYRTAGEIKLPDNEKIHNTKCVNGIWRTGETQTVGAYMPGKPYVSIKKHPDISNCTDIMDSLYLNQPTLVLDPFRGFRITHRPEDMPREIRTRQYFAYISIANCSTVIEHGDNIRIDNDANRGNIYHG